jgi:hypothetical protein
MEADKTRTWNGFSSVGKGHLNSLDGAAFELLQKVVRQKYVLLDRGRCS